MLKLAVTDREFVAYIQQMKTYRDKFVAHLDDDRKMMVPNLAVAKKSATFLYKRLLDQEAGTGTFNDAPKSPTVFYDAFFIEAQQEYSNAGRTREN